MFIDLVTPFSAPRAQPVERGSYVAEHQAAPFHPLLPIEAKQTGDAAAENAQSVDDAVRELKETIKPFNISLQFSNDEESGSTVVKMVDQRTGEVLRQFPEEARLHLAAALGKLQGRIFNRKA